MSVFIIFPDVSDRYFSIINDVISSWTFLTRLTRISGQTAIFTLSQRLPFLLKIRF